MSMRGAVAGSVMLMLLVVLLSERTEGHITFFSPNEMMLMKERESRKDMESRSEDSQFEEVAIQQLPQMERGDNHDKTLEFAARFSPKQMDLVALVLEEIMDEIVEEHQKGASV